MLHQTARGLILRYPECQGGFAIDRLLGLTQDQTEKPHFSTNEPDDPFPLDTVAECPS
jgi:hypothetical protein